MEEFRKLLPFSIYDFFGYLFPSTIFVTMSAFSIVTAYPKLLDILNPIIRTFAPLFNGPLGVASSIFLVVFCVACLYFFGHSIATISHVFYDRIIVKNIFGYPVENLLGFPQKRKRTVEATYFYLASTFLLYLFFIPIDRIINQDNAIIEIILSFLFGWGWLIVGLISLVILYLNKRYYYEVGGWDKKSLKLKAFDHLSDAYYLPYKMINYLIVMPAATLFACTDKMPDVIIERFNKRLSIDLSIPESDGHTINTEAYWFPIYKIYSSDNPWREKIENWMNLYAFMRNLSVAGYLICIEIAVLLSHVCRERFGVPGNTEILTAVYYSVLSISVLVGIRFWIFYRNYYSKNIIRGYCYENTNAR